LPNFRVAASSDSAHVLAAARGHCSHSSDPVCVQAGGQADLGRRRKIGHFDHVGGSPASTPGFNIAA